MVILTWMTKWQNEIELIAMLCQLIFLAGLMIGIFCMVRQQKKANRTRRRLELYLKKRMDKPVEKPKQIIVPQNIHKENEKISEEENRIISTVLQEIFP